MRTTRPALLAARYRMADGLQLRQEATMGDDGWAVDRQVLAMPQGLRWTEEVDPLVLALVGGCDGTVPLRDQLALLAVGARGGRTTSWPRPPSRSSRTWSSAASSSRHDRRAGMRAVVQTVSRASVTVDDEVVGAIADGLLVLLGVTHDDTAAIADTMARKVYELRILDDETSASDVGAPVLVVSQFTLYGDARKGRRPTWTAAAPAEVAEPLVTAFAEALRAPRRDGRNRTVPGAHAGGERERRAPNRPAGPC